jgi:hypothetical protein
MQKTKAVKIGMLCLLMVAGIFASVMYALAYSEKRELIYSNTITIESKEVKFRAFYLSAPAGSFEVKMTVSKGTIKWTPHSAVMFEDTLGWFPCKVGDKMMGTIQRWVCETNGEVIRWSVDQENVDMVWYLNIFNNDYYDKEVHIEVTKVWEEQNCNGWL